MTYNLDPDLAPWTAMLPRGDLRDIPTARAEADELIAQTARAQGAVPTDALIVTDRTVPGPPGSPGVPVRVYTPRDRDGLLPGLINIHGGGFVLGSIEMDHAFAAAIATAVGAVVVSVEYRLAPEHPFPAALDDCYAAATWFADQASELGVDPARIGVNGLSAGGCLAAGLALIARDRGGPALCFQSLDIPVIDDRLDTVSMRDYVDTPLWDRTKAELSWAHYLGKSPAPGDPEVSAYAAPARAEDLSGLPPAHITVCQFDPLRDEGIAYATRLSHAGVHVDLHLYPGTFHASTLIAGAPVSQRMINDKIEALRRGLAAPTAGSGH